jgi:metal-responsive CopG/Arc/MetJ family transcriptional regulator
VRVKTSVTLPEDLLARIDRTEANRSVFLERAARAYLARLEKAARDQNDLDIINAHADELNQEALDVLDYQGWP